MSLLPGPVEISAEVKEVLEKPWLYHRSNVFKTLYEETREILCALSKAKYVQIFSGSGTLANDIITSQLSLIEGKGLILSNGEFGDRLIDHGDKFSLNFETYTKDWGEEFDLTEVDNILKNNPDIKWVYMVHCETSTAILNDFKAILHICKRYDKKLCLDAISSFGNEELIDA